MSLLPVSLAGVACQCRLSVSALLLSVTVMFVDNADIQLVGTQGACLVEGTRWCCWLERRGNNGVVGVVVVVDGVFRDQAGRFL